MTYKIKIKQSIKRLQRLRRVFANATPSVGGEYILKSNGERHVFKIDWWNFALSRNEAQVHNCGTACCVAGVAGHIPEFRRAGLKSAGNNTVTFKAREGVNAFSEFFGINFDRAREITLPEFYPPNADGVYVATPKRVLKKLDAAIGELKADLRASY